MNNFRYFAILLLLSFSTSCCDDNQSDSEKIDIALQLSGNNRPELEKVLHHYSLNPKDSLKLKAAEFLISNMTHHRSMSGECIENQIKNVDTLYDKLSLSVRSVYYMIPSRIDSLKSKVVMEADIEKITAEFLIRNIEYSFKVWENSIYEPRISFEDFCEYILPYKHGEEPLILWKDSLDSYNVDSRDLYNYELNMVMADIYHSYMNHNQYYITYDQLFPNKDIYMEGENVKAQVHMNLAYMRTKGIPIAIDFIPFTTILRDSYWMLTINRKYLNDNNVSINKGLSSKVFRKTYSLNPTPEDKNNFIPEFIRNPYNKDVTATYQNVTTIEYDFGDVSPNVKYAYLAVFYRGEWCEVAWAELSGGKATFRDMGRDVIYLPIYYNGTQRVCANSLILIDRNENKKGIGRVTEEMQSVKVNRISYYNLSGEYDKKSILGGKIAVSNNLESLKFDTLATITHSKYQQFDTLNINSNKKYKYWLFMPNGYANVAELHFYHNDSCLVGEIIFDISIKGDINKLRQDINKLSDNDVSTYWPMNTPVGIEFTQPVSVTHVNYICRTDGNGIIPGNEYELFYFNDGEWVSLAKKVATDYNIEFENIPTDALLWVHDYGKKCDERPFTVVNGKIKFW